MKRSLQHLALLAAAAAFACLAASSALRAALWVGSPFPGFLVGANRVVPSISLPTWNTHATGVFQQEVLAVEGRPVDSPGTVYQAVRAQPPGTAIRYTLRAPDGTTTIEVATSLRFSWLDLVLLCGAHLLCAAALLGAGFLVFWLRPDARASGGLLSACTALGVVLFTTADLGGDPSLFRLRVLAEAILPAALLHLALVFPRDRLQRHRALALGAVYLPSLLFAAAYQAVLERPGAYTVLHLAANELQGVGALVFVLSVLHARWSMRPSPAWPFGAIAAGTVVAFLVTALLAGSSGVLGGIIPLNVSVFAVLLFPLSLGHAALRDGLFHRDPFRKD